MNDQDEKFMNLAFDHAKIALNNNEVPVGCLFVYDNDVDEDLKTKIIAVGSNTVNLTKNATRHAEINCIDEVITYYDKLKLTTNKYERLSDFLKNVSVYVTVEPCIMCMDALHQLEIKQIVYSCNNDRFGGRTVFDVGRYKNSRHTPIIKSGYRSDEAMELLKEFYNGTNPNAPISKVKIKPSNKSK